MEGRGVGGGVGVWQGLPSLISINDYFLLVRLMEGIFFVFNVKMTNEPSCAQCVVNTLFINTMK